jgi:flagellar biosynthesis protein
MRQGKIRKAVALSYDPQQAGAPQVIAGGRGEVAARIVELAREAGVEVVEDRDLVEILAQVPIGEEIPEDLYVAVAEILAFVYRMNGRYRKDPEQGPLR